MAQAATDRSAELASYVSDDELESTVNDAIDKNTVIAGMADDIKAVDDKIGDLSAFDTGDTGKGVTVAQAIAGVDDAVNTLESKALTTENYCTNKPSECTGDGIGTGGK